jgi:hypothetical protein
MSNDVSFSADAADFDDAVWLDWAEHPQQGPMSGLQRVSAAMQHYLFNEGGVEIDIAGPPVYVSRCGKQGYDYNFDTGEGVLLGDNLAGKLPVHLFFNPPVAGVGAQVSAVGPVGKAYLAQLAVRLDDGQWQMQPGPGKLSRQRGTAPFLGARCANGRSITELWFDVVDPNNQVDFTQVAINHLYFVPA